MVEILAADNGVNVFVTGFGPFPRGDGGQYERNASHLVTKLLPDRIPANSTLNPNKKDINIINPTAADGAYVKTEYAYIRSYVKEMHEQYGGTVDLFVHIGQADGWDFVSVEERAYRQGMTTTWTSQPEHYLIPDNAGKTVRDIGSNPWEGTAPLGLVPALSVGSVVLGAQSQLKMLQVFGRSRPIQVRAHADPGAYCCGFIFSESLAQCHVRGRKGNVLFCHVPALTDSDDLNRATDAVLAVIVSGVNELIRTRAV